MSSGSPVLVMPLKGDRGSPDPLDTAEDSQPSALSPAVLHPDKFASPRSPVIRTPLGVSGGSANALDDNDIALCFPSTNGGSPPKGREPMFSLKLNIPRLPAMGLPSAWTPTPPKLPAPPAASPTTASPPRASRDKVIKVVDGLEGSSSGPSRMLFHWPALVWKSHYIHYLIFAMLVLLGLGLGLGLGLTKVTTNVPSPVRPGFKNVTTTSNVTVITYQNVTTLTTVKSTSLGIKLPVTDVNSAVGSALRCDLSSALATLGVDLSAVTLTGTASMDNSTTSSESHTTANTASTCSSRLLRLLLQGRGLEDSSSSSSSSNATNSTSLINTTSTTPTSSGCANTTSTTAVSSVGITIADTDNAAAIAALLSTFNFSAVASVIAADPCLIPAGYTLASMVPVVESVVNTTSVVATVTEVATITVVTQVVEQVVVNSEDTTPSAAPSPSATRSSTATSSSTATATASKSALRTATGGRSLTAFPTPSGASTPSLPAGGATASPGENSTPTPTVGWPTSSPPPAPTVTRVDSFPPSLTGSASPSVSPSASATLTPIASHHPTPTPPPSSQLTSSATPTPLPSNGLSVPPTPSSSPSLSSSPQASLTNPPSGSASASSLASPPASDSPSSSMGFLTTQSPEPSPTFSPTRCVSLSSLPTPSRGGTASGGWGGAAVGGGGPTPSSSACSSASSLGTPTLPPSSSPQHFSTPSTCPSTSSTPSASESGAVTPTTSQSPSLSPMPSGPYCSPGYFLNLTGHHYGPNLGDGLCTPCPLGYACPGGGIGGAVILPCLATPGYFCPTGNPTQEGILCPQGFFCPHTAATANGTLPCPTGTFSELGAANCSALPMGAVAIAPQTALLTPCTSPPGFYCPAPPTLGVPGNATGVPCPAGYACTGGWLPPFPCAPGTFSLGGGTTCTPCPFNTFGATYALPRGVCSGTYLGGGNAFVEPPGSFYATYYTSVNEAVTPVPVACDPGTYAADFYLSPGVCLPCPPGYACPGGGVNTPPTPCLPPLFARAVGGARNCTLLPPSLALTLLSLPFPTSPSMFNPLFPSLYPVGTRACPAGTHPFRANATQTNATNNATFTNTSSFFSSSVPFSQCMACPGGRFGLPAEWNGRFQGRMQRQGLALTSDSPECTGPCAAPPGNFCPPGSHVPTGIACPFNATCAGGSGLANCTTLGWVFNLSNGNVCTPCWPGSQAAAGNTACEPCPFGTWGNTTGLVACAPCTNTPGYFCPTGSRNATGVPCPAGSYRATADPMQGGCIPSTSTPAGSYTPQGSIAATGTPCPEGMWCAGGVVGPRVCPPGSYSTGGASLCTLCPEGYYSAKGSSSDTCDGLCTITAGAYCPIGSTAIGGSACPAGFECSPITPLPAAAALPVSPKACSPGKYSSKGASSCSLCPEAYHGLGYSMEYMACSGACVAELGYYCPAGTNTTQGSPCPGGYICPLGGPTLPKPCFAGTYAPPGQTVCTNATAGFYAGDAAAVQSPCMSPGGMYCPDRTGSSQGVSCPPGYSCAGYSDQPVLCPTGTYSLGGSPFCTQCSEGTFGNTTGLTTPSCTANCTLPLPGYYCPSGSVADFEGYVSFGGYYAQGGGNAHFPCAPGTFSLFAASSCLPCAATPGSFCGPGCSTATGCSACPQGLYCPGGGSVPSLATNTTPGTYLPASSTSASSAVTCTPGTYCPNTQAGNGQECLPWYNCTAIPAGYFYTPKQCPAATGSLAGSLAATACSACTAAAGSYCPVGSPPAGVLCPEGNFCTGGATALAPCTTSGAPAGKHCPAGSASNAGVACPAGMKCKGGANLAEWCYEGSYATGGATACTVGGCSGPNYLPAGSTSSAGVACPDGFSIQNCFHAPCPQGKYCTGGAAIPCAAGTWTNLTETPSPGCPFTCVSTVLGYWCGPGAPLSYGIPCKEGYYGGTLGLTSTTCSGECTVAPGQYCPSGSLEGVIGTPCTAGYTCAGGIAQPVACPPGSYSLAGASTCSPCTCDPGYSCKSFSSKPAGVACELGQFCTGGSAPTAACTTCASGRYCPVLSSDPSCTPVEEGFFSYGGGNMAACYSSTGKYCPAGSYGANSGSNPTIACPAGYRCLQNAKHYGCEAGTYSLASAQTCTICSGDPGTYCPDLCTSNGVACPGGHSCGGAAEAPVPCPPGTSASGGKAACTPCSSGTYAAVNASSSCLGCTSAPGWYCPLGSTFAAGLACHPGSVCAGGSAPNATCTLPSFPNTARTACQACPATAGSYCDASGDVQACPEGSFCLGVAGQPTPCTSTVGTYCPPGQGVSVNTPCPVGSFCGGGGTVHLPCPEGTYGAGVAVRSLCTNCTLPTPGTFCPLGSSGDSVGGAEACTPGAFCLGGSYPRLPCPAGYASSSLGATVCTECPQGTWSPANASLCSPCAALPASYCPAATPAAAGALCPPGYACPLGGTAPPVVCPPGRFSAGGRVSCQECPTGVYGSTPGLTTAQCTAPCSPLTPTLHCPSGSTSNTLQPCPAGSACPGTPFAVAAACAPGSFSPPLAPSCTPCPAGRYGGFHQLTTANCSGPCTLGPGFFCAQGSQGPQDATPCPEGGFTCLGGSTLPTFCAPGLIQDAGSGACVGKLRSCSTFITSSDFMSNMLPSNYTACFSGAGAPTLSWTAPTTGKYLLAFAVYSPPTAMYLWSPSLTAAGSPANLVEALPTNGCTFSGGSTIVGAWTRSGLAGLPPGFMVPAAVTPWYDGSFQSFDGPFGDFAASAGTVYTLTFSFDMDADSSNAAAADGVGLAVFLVPSTGAPTAPFPTGMGKFNSVITGACF